MLLITVENPIAERCQSKGESYSSALQLPGHSSKGSIWHLQSFTVFTTVVLPTAAIQLSRIRLVGSLKTNLGSSYLAPGMLNRPIKKMNKCEMITESQKIRQKSRTPFIIAESQISIRNNYACTFHNSLCMGYFRF